ncbi:MAG: tetratricopeptide repeat protein [Caulobacteraceae bacterium]
MSDDQQMVWKAERLMAKAHKLLDNGQWQAALKVAQQLELMRYSGTFEIKALALSHAGQPAEALAALEDGVKKSPTVPLLWEMLGNARSDAGEFEEAFRAYEQARGLDEGVLPSLEYNYSLALVRAGRRDEARACIRNLLEAPELKDADNELIELVSDLRVKLAGRSYYGSEGGSYGPNE